MLYDLRFRPRHVDGAAQGLSLGPAARVGVRVPLVQPGPGGLPGRPPHRRPRLRLPAGAPEHGRGAAERRRGRVGVEARGGGAARGLRDHHRLCARARELRGLGEGGAGQGGGDGAGSVPPGARGGPRRGRRRGAGPQHPERPADRVLHLLEGHGLHRPAHAPGLRGRGRQGLRRPGGLAGVGGGLQRAQLDALLRTRAREGHAGIHATLLVLFVMPRTGSLRFSWFERTVLA
mmetsp:Transcript_78310/g.221427  ORF Transcript_78310/g.221427 Transcript_78310/m.221427 type:complete len:233 (+) Transcript_78310:565-1263(+)